MQLPKDLQHFVHPTLLVLADHVQAKFWLAGGEGIEELDPLALSRELKSDREASFVNVDTNSANAPEPKTDEERLRQFGHMIAERIEQMVRSQRAAHVFLVMDAKIGDMVIADLHKDVVKSIIKILHHNLMKEHLLDVIRRLYEKEK